MARIVGSPDAELAAQQPTGARYDVDWVVIADPAPTFDHTPGEPAPTTNDAALRWIGDQGRAQGAARFSRLEGAAWSRGKVFFTSTQGGGPAEAAPDPTIPVADGYGNGSGQVWSYDPRRSVLTCELQSPGRDVLDLPDNVAARRDGGAIVLCEDNVDDNYVRGLTARGELFDIALNRLRSASGADRSNDEFAGATFSPDGGTLFVNIQAATGMTFAIWGPWARLGV
jgi:secreted PhoX family phosphatase